MQINQSFFYVSAGFVLFFVTALFFHAPLVSAADTSDAKKPDVQLNGGDEVTNNLHVTLRFFNVAKYDEVRMSNKPQFLVGSWEPLAQTVDWILLPGEGKKTVYIELRGPDGESISGSRNITYKQLRGDLQSGRVVTAGDGFFYYLGFDEQLHPYPTMAIYHSWHDDFNKIDDVDPVILKKYPIGIPVCARLGSWLVQFSGFPTIYAVEPGCRLRPIRSETEGFLFYGSSWKKRIIVLSNVQRQFYSINQSGISMPIKDSDDDGLSDQEEKLYWQTNPLEKDSDADGMADGAEIQAGRSPLGSGNVSEEPIFKYRHPIGSVVNEPGSGSSLYIPVLNGIVRGVSKGVLKETSTAPGYQSVFFSRPPYRSGLAARAENVLVRSEDRFFFPTIYFKNNLILH